MKDKLVSIVIPCYNQEKYISKCIKSVINQTYKNLEIIIVNDGSKDNSLEVINRFTDKRIVILNEINSGVEHARINGINNSKGDYLFFVDGDDWIPNNSIESLLNAMEKNNVDIVIGNSKRCAGILKSVSNQNIIGKISQPQLFDEYYVTYFGWNKIPVQIWGALYKTDLIKKHLPIECGVRHGEDLLFNMHLYPFVDSIFVTNEVVYYYRYGGMTNKINYKLFEEACRTYRFKQKQLDDYKYNIGYELIAKELLNFYITYIKDLFLLSKLKTEDIIDLAIRNFNQPSFQDALNKLNGLNYKANITNLLLEDKIDEMVALVKPNKKDCIKFKVKKIILNLLIKITL